MEGITEGFFRDVLEVEICNRRKNVGRERGVKRDTVTGLADKLE